MYAHSHRAGDVAGVGGYRAAREFRVLREGEGEAWRLELPRQPVATGAVKARTDQVLAFADGGGRFCEGVGI